MDIIFTVKAESEQENVRFMMILFYQDGTRIGKTESVCGKMILPPRCKKVLDVCTESGDFTVQPGINMVSVSVPNKGLADGAYYYEISILQRSRSFAREKCDCIPNVIPFVINNTEVFGINGEKWQSNYWGHIMMEPIQVNPLTMRRI